MLDPGEPKFRRRKADRPAEIVAAALAVFAEKGFAAARLEEIARHAGVSKGALYLYFETKDDLFRAVVAQAVAPSIELIRAMMATHPGPIADLLRGLATRIGGLIETLPVGGVLKMVIGEARNFPGLARVWHDDLVAHVLDALTEAIAAAQARGEVKAGDPRAYALQIIAPMLVGVIWRETFVPVGAQPFDLPALARQHIETMIEGLKIRAPTTGEAHR
ncbi:TetR/AcrR family transcriptional regulator [Phenylobacterium sp.]|uniref:TetR/AcrR family transcriptional regulator n=1 Tax=Phenylobacterium sp. TaxID=1871053 RepID=UPI00286C3C0E|nr:TetR/AcrR family transcriptional regulator [Phenylobacterium sp.]